MQYTTAEESWREREIEAETNSNSQLFKLHCIAYQVNVIPEFSNNSLEICNNAIKIQRAYRRRNVTQYFPY